MRLPVWRAQSSFLRAQVPDYDSQSKGPSLEIYGKKSLDLAAFQSEPLRVTAELDTSPPCLPLLVENYRIFTE